MNGWGVSGLQEGQVPVTKAKAGRWYGPAGSVGTTSPAEGNAHAVALFWPGGNVDRIGVGVSTAGSEGTVARLGIYSDDGEGYPASLILDAGTVDTSSTGHKEIAIDLNLPPGLYWLVCVSQNVSGGTPPTYRAIANSANWPFGAGDTFDINTQCSYRYSNVTSDLPPTWTATITSVAPGPRTMLRAA